MTVKTVHSAPTYSGGNFEPPEDNVYSLGTAALSWKDLNVQTVVYATSVAGNWSPSAAATYTLGTTALEWLAGYFSDDSGVFLGSDQDDVLYHRTAVLNANTALTGVLVGTPVAQALAANSLIISNVTASGDVAMYGNLGGNSQQFLFYDTSASILYLARGTNPSIVLDTTVADSGSSKIRFFEAGSGSFDIEHNCITNTFNIISGAGAGANVLSFAMASGAATFENVAYTNTAAANVYRMSVASANAITLNTGTVPVLASLAIAEPNITIGTGAVTTAASLYISGAPTEGTTNNVGIYSEVSVALANYQAIKWLNTTGTAIDVLFLDSGNSTQLVSSANSLYVQYNTAQDIYLWSGTAGTGRTLYLKGTNAASGAGNVSDAPTFRMESSYRNGADVLTAWDFDIYHDMTAGGAAPASSALFKINNVSIMTLTNTNGTPTIGVHGNVTLDNGKAFASSRIQLDWAGNGILDTSAGDLIIGSATSIVSLKHVTQLDVRLSDGDGAFYSLGARDSDTDLRVEVARVAGAADPYFSMGGSQQFKFYNSGIFEIGGAVAVSSTADAVQISSYDISAGNRTLALSTETAVAADVGLASTHSLTVRINGASYKIPLVSA